MGCHYVLKLLACNNLEWKCKKETENVEETQNQYTD